MDRRDFLRQVAAFSAAAAAVPLIKIPVSAQTTAPSATPLVVTGKSADYTDLTRKVIAKLGGMRQFVKAGDKVVIKPNIGWDRTPEQGANTHPLIIVTLVQLALDAGAKQVQVFDRSCDDTRRSYATSGIKAAVEAMKDPRVSCPYCDDARFIPVKIDNGQAIHEWQLYKDALEADCYINVPIPKHHSMAKLTLSMKNIMGICGGSRGQLHQQHPEKMVDLNMVIRPKLTVIDATRILLRHGPKGGDLADVQKLDTMIASTDPVAADAQATTLFNMKPEDIPCTVAAFKRGLGQIDLSKVNLVTV